ncbi:MAG: hypothetical protein K6G12_09750 [Lachnospiraceae bacterium]|nr:hypothetical protein [Lachnospiraceae bacterium]
MINKKIIDITKIIVYISIVVFLSVLAIKSFGYISGVTDFDAGSTRDDSVILNLVFFSLIWFGITEILKPSDQYYIVMQILMTIGQMALGLLSISYEWVSNLTNHILSSSVYARKELSTVIHLVIYNLKHPWVFTAVLLVVTLIVIPRFSVRIIAYCIAEFVAYLIDRRSIMTALIALEIVIIGVSIWEAYYDQYNLSEDKQITERVFPPLKCEWILFGVCVVGVIVSGVLGKITSWADYIRLAFSNDYTDVLEVRNTFDALLIVSILFSFSISGALSSFIKESTNKHIIGASANYGETASILTSVSCIMLDSLINIWILDHIIDLLVRLYSGDIKRASLADASSVPEWIVELDAPKGVSPALSVIITIGCILFILAFIIASNILFATGWFIVAKSLVEGLVFLYIAFFINRLFVIDYSNFSAISTFILLYGFNLLAATLSENIAKRSIIKDFLKNIQGA